MRPSRVIWICWCLAWVLIWLLVAGHDAIAYANCHDVDQAAGGQLVNCGASAPVWGPLAWLAAAALSALAILLPVGKPVPEGLWLWWANRAGRSR